MSFWIISAAMAALVAALIARALMRGPEQQATDVSDFDVKIYRDQLAEVERDVARGVVGAEDAERARTEISRRILAADVSRQEAAADVPVFGRAAIILVTVTLIGGSLAMYNWLGQPGYGDLALADRIAVAERLRENRPNQQTAVDSLPPFAEPDGTSDKDRQLLTRLREALAKRPGDLQGYTLLAQEERKLGNFVGAAEAQEMVLRIKGDSVSADDISDYGQFLVMAAGGYVSPEAETAFRAALNLNEDEGRARYFLGLMMLQTGRPDIGFRLWDALLRRGPAQAPWIDPILAQIEQVSQLAGVNYTIPAIGSGSASGPSIEDIEAASEMSAEERMEMIGGMVEGLSNRLATEGGPPQDWARLITSLAILGNRNQALAVFNNAMDVFAGDAGARDIVRAAGSQAGIAE